MKWQDYITSDPEILAGKLDIKGTRVKISSKGQVTVPKKFREFLGTNLITSEDKERLCSGYY